MSWWRSATEHPVATLGYAAAVGALTAVAALLLGRVTAAMRSLRAQVLAITLVSLLLGAVLALVLARLMVLSASQVRAVTGVLVLTAGFASALVIAATAPLRRDVQRLERTVRSIEAGDRTVRSGLRRSDELGHVAAALDALNARLDELETERASYEAERRALLSSIGHDLRTPLAAIRAALEALIDGVAPDPDRYLDAMQHDVRALSSLIDDLFLLSRIESGRLELPRAPVDLSELADTTVQAMQPIADERGVQLRLEVSGRVQVPGNATALGRVLRNLLDNGIRHAPPGSVVVVRLDADRPPVVRVVDEGPGFPVGFREHAFDGFARADLSRTRATGGAGLGLAIARGLVEAHGGRIWIEPEPGGHVAFELPVGAAS